MSVLSERRDGGNASKSHKSKRNKNKKSKNQSHPSNPSTTSLSSSGGDSKKTVNKKKENAVKISRNTPTPPPSGPPPPGSPPKRPLPVLPSRIPLSYSHRRSLGASHKIGSKPQNPVLPSGTMGARKRSSLSSMRFSPSPSKRRSSFLLGVSSFYSPTRGGGGGRASVLSSTFTPSPGQPRLPPSYASSQCLPSVDTMASLASATSSESSVDDTSGADTTDYTNKKPASQVQKQQVFTTPDNATNNRGGQNGHRGHARLLSELSTTLRLVHEEEDAAAAEQAAASSAVSTRTAAAGVSS
ncbi:hypothetical protein PG996_002381 [Apiospora saccharicola]|uniref:Uncharacterized protein n=1 Tax=Apiospora saccharicola TaxID=335842 RepID=A0ABR1WMB2_9PEZI